MPLSSRLQLDTQIHFRVLSILAQMQLSGAIKKKEFIEVFCGAEDVKKLLSGELSFFVRACEEFFGEFSHPHINNARPTHELVHIFIICKQIHGEIPSRESLCIGCICWLQQLQSQFSTERWSLWICIEKKKFTRVN